MNDLDVIKWLLADPLGTTDEVLRLSGRHAPEPAGASDGKGLASTPQVVRSIKRGKERDGVAKLHTAVKPREMGHS